MAKNVKIDIHHCSARSLRKPIDCYQHDLINTFKEMMMHRPIFSHENLAKFEGEPEPLFLQPKLKIKRKDNIWFLKKAVGKNTLAKVTLSLIEQTEGIIIGNRRFSNKSARRIGISRMEESLVHVEKGMMTTGHRDHKSYQSYNALPRIKDNKVIQRIISGTDAVDATGRLLTYSEILEDEEEKIRSKQVYNCTYLFFLS